MTTMMMQCEAENRRLGRREDEDEIARQVASSPYFRAVVEGREEL